jgi:hypothetical protein
MVNREDEERFEALVNDPTQISFILPCQSDGDFSIVGFNPFTGKVSRSYDPGLPEENYRDYSIDIDAFRQGLDSYRDKRIKKEYKSLKGIKDKEWLKSRPYVLEISSRNCKVPERMVMVDPRFFKGVRKLRVSIDKANREKAKDKGYTHYLAPRLTFIDPDTTKTYRQNLISVNPDYEGARIKPVEEPFYKRGDKIRVIADWVSKQIGKGPFEVIDYANGLVYLWTGTSHEMLDESFVEPYKMYRGDK